MADLDKRRRFAGRLKRLMDVAVEAKNVEGGIRIARLVMTLEGWFPANSKDDTPPEAPEPAPDMTGLLQLIDGTTQSNDN